MPRFERFTRRALTLVVAVTPIVSAACGDDPPQGDGGNSGRAGMASGGGAGAERGGAGGSSQGGEAPGGSSTGGAAARGGGGTNSGGEGGTTAGGGEGGASAGGEGGDDGGGAGGTAGRAGRGSGGFAGSMIAGSGGASAGTGGSAGTSAGTGGSAGASAGTGGTGGSGGAITCAKVAHDGDDAIATQNAGQTPFASIQAAIDFADSHRNITTRVCVANGATCGGGIGYSTDTELRMRNGISVYGGYESTAFTRCPGSMSGLWPDSPLGVVFESDVQSETVLDGFEIDLSGIERVLVIDVRGASGVRLSRLRLLDATRGIDMIDAEVVASDVTMDLEGQAAEAFGARAIDSRFEFGGAISLEANVSLTTGIWLERSPGSKIAGVIDVRDGESEASGVRVIGDASGVEITNSTISVEGGVSIGLESCEGAAPLIANNPSIVTVGASQPAPIEAIRSIGDCRTRIESNGTISARGPSATAIRCAPSEGQPSRCVLANNAAIYTESLNCLNGGSSVTTGVLCEGGSCEAIRQNSVTGIRVDDCDVSCSFNAYGLDLRGTDARVERNRVAGGCGARVAGIRLEGSSSRIENNFITGRKTRASPNQDRRISSSVGIVHFGGDIDVHSNTIDPGGTTNALSCTSAAVATRGVGAYTNNIVLSGVCNVQSAFVFNTLDFPGPTSPSSGGPRTSNFEGDPLFVSSTDSHLSPMSPCIDTGATDGAPLLDFDGEPRDTRPDIGADEYVPAGCSGVTCSGHGVCENPGSGPACDCDDGYALSPTDPLVCEALPNPCEPNPCAGNAVCTPNGSSGYSCACPPGTSGDNCEIVFVEIAGGDEHTCGVRSDGTIGCWGNDADGRSTPPTGTFTKITAGSRHTCALRTDDTIACFGYDPDGRSTPPSGAFMAVAAGAFNTCGLRLNGTAECWGDNFLGQSEPAAGTFTAITAAGYHVCAIAAGDGSVVCWGNDGDGQATPPPGAFSAISAGGAHTCGLHANGDVECWGYNSSGQTSPVPTGPFYQVGAGGYYSCALSSVISCWGYDAAGQASPPPGAFDALFVMVGHACAIRASGEVVCWGSDLAGETVPP